MLSYYSSTITTPVSIQTEPLLERDVILGEVRKQFKLPTPNPIAVNKAFEAGEITLQQKEQILAFAPEKVESNHVMAFDRLIDGARKPFSPRVAPIKVDDGYSQSIISIVADEHTHFSFDNNESRTRLIQASLLMCAYKSGTLSESEFKRLLPRDPFSPNQLIVKDTIAYSVGPDGEDDGDQPFKNVWRVDAETKEWTQANPKVL